MTRKEAEYRSDLALLKALSTLSWRGRERVHEFMCELYAAERDLQDRLERAAARN